MLNFAGIDIQADNIVNLLKQELAFHAVCQQIAHGVIIQNRAKAQGILITEEEVQAESERLRRELKLESAQKTIEWLKERMVTAEEWEKSIYDRLLREKLSAALFSKEATRHFNQNRLDYQQISLYKIAMNDSKLAQELVYQIEESEISFFEAAHQYNLDAAHRKNCGYEGEFSRWALPPDITTSVFAVPAKSVVGPMTIEGLSVLFYVNEISEPELSEDIQKEICDRLFSSWLEGELQRLTA